jgi:hypothetical protein
MGNNSKYPSPQRKQVQQRIVVCGSMAFYEEMQDIREQLDALKIGAIIPEAEGEIIRNLPPEQFERFKRDVSRSYLAKIRDRKTFGVLAMNYEKHSSPNYLGPNTFAEIAVAFANKKKIYLYFDMPEMYKEELSAWEAVCLNGSLSRLEKDFRTLENVISSQYVMWEDIF